MAEIKDGGPAFPGSYEFDQIPPYDPERPNAIHVAKPVKVFQSGMTLRDYFAANADIEPEIGVKYAETLLGRAMPDYAADPLANAIFWADARACLRYIEADAMLRAKGEPCAS
ncbi:hypothetical protein [Cupriavidus numazuensis]|uniref:Uncharacterized protein n=1 Tax=Cupriavidus numazuensis TaxID=221992 RepID=A0ABM8TBS0_9BURK|nr:hypothetical protein [Cupriavidus numazuensis]CAG2132211.1 hypothetical protein LMG26411_00576 [Cupriavidus numazuensis]